MAVGTKQKVVFIVEDGTLDNFISIVLAVFASTGLWQFLIKVYENRKQKRTPSEKMILALGRDKLLFLNKKYRQMGYIPEDEYEAYSGLYDAYIGMGGNSLVKKGYENNKSLPIKDAENQTR